VKTKPTQHSVKALRELGIQPDILLCRTEHFLSPEIKSKLALFCDVDEDAVITAKDVDSIYEVPLVFHQEGLDHKVIEVLNIWTGAPHLDKWQEIVRRVRNPRDEVVVGMVGKYVALSESYKSLNEALAHGGIANKARVNIHWIEAEGMENGDLRQQLSTMDGILVPGGFGIRGVAGMIHAIRFAREKKLPFFGICLGLQCAVIEYARNVCGMTDADSTEFNPQSSQKVIYKLKELEGVDSMGANMRLGRYPCLLQPQSFAHQAYGATEISERHRHRYEVNRALADGMVKKGLKISGQSPDGRFVEIIELADHPWFLACQFHPEFKSKPLAPHPLFRSFIGACLQRRTHDEPLGARRSSIAGV
jgi:CTP synthase